MCPICGKNELSLATAHCWNTIRLSCDCGYSAELSVSPKLSDELCDVLREIKEQSGGAE